MTKKNSTIARISLIILGIAISIGIGIGIAKAQNRFAEESIASAALASLERTQRLEDTQDLAGTQDSEGEPITEATVGVVG